MLPLYDLFLILMGWADAGLALAKLFSVLWCTLGRYMGSRSAWGTLFCPSKLSVLARRYLISVDWEVLLSSQASTTSSPSPFNQNSAWDIQGCRAACRVVLWFPKCSFPKQLLLNSWLRKSVYVGGTPSKHFLVLESKIQNFFFRVFLVVQWLRLCLAMQGTPVGSLVWEGLTCCGAAKPAHHNCEACALEPLSRTCSQRSRHNEKPAHRNGVAPTHCN